MAMEGHFGLILTDAFKKCWLEHQDTEKIKLEFETGSVLDSGGITLCNCESCKKKLQSKFGHAENIKWLFKHAQAIRLVDKKIKDVSVDLKPFSHLKILNLIGNQISEVKGEMLPSSLEVVELGYNNVHQFFFRDYPFPNMIMMNLNCNFLTNLDSMDVSYFIFPNLHHLDLSYNDILCLVYNVNVLKYLAQLKVLYLKGNPCSLSWCYQPYVMEKIPSLTFLDGIPITWKVRHMMNLWKAKGDNLDPTVAFMKIEVVRVLNLEFPVNAPGFDPELKVDWNYHIEYNYPKEAFLVDGFTNDTGNEMDQTFVDTAVEDSQSNDSLDDVQLHKCPSFGISEVNNIEDVCLLKFTDMYALRKFLLSGLRVQIVETAIPYNAITTTGGKGKAEVEYERLEPTVSVVETFMVTLESFIDGHSSIQFFVWDQSKNRSKARAVSENLRNLKFAKEAVQQKDKDKKGKKVEIVPSPSFVKEPMLCHLAMELPKQIAINGN